MFSFHLVLSCAQEPLSHSARPGQPHSSLLQEEKEAQAEKYFFQLCFSRVESCGKELSPSGDMDLGTMICNESGLAPR